MFSNLSGVLLALNTYFCDKFSLETKHAQNALTEHLSALDNTYSIPQGSASLYPQWNWTVREDVSCQFCCKVINSLLHGLGCSGCLNREGSYIQASRLDMNTQNIWLKHHFTSVQPRVHLSLSGSVDNFLSVEQLHFSGKRGWDGQTQLYQVTKKNSDLTSTTQPCQLSSRPGLRAVHDMQIRQKSPLLTPQDGGVTFLTRASLQPLGAISFLR